MGKSCDPLRKRWSQATCDHGKPGTRENNKGQLHVTEQEFSSYKEDSYLIF